MRTDATLTVRADPHCVGTARELVLARCEGLCPPPELEAIQLMVSELVTNVIRHTPTGDGELRLLLDDGAVRIEVEDQGTGIPDRPAVPDRRRGGGFGLFVVDRLADRWGVWDGNCIWFEVDLQRAIATSGHDALRRLRRHGGAQRHHRTRRLTVAEAPARA